MLHYTIYCTHMAEQQFSPEEELRGLSQRLEERKETLRKEGGPVPEEKEIFREVLKERIEEVRPPMSSLPPVTHVPAAPQKVDNTQINAKNDAAVREVIEAALAHGVERAIKVAESESPWLLDELHDHLVDDFYDKLLALKKVEPM